MTKEVRKQGTALDKFRKNIGFNAENEDERITICFDHQEDIRRGIASNIRHHWKHALSLLSLNAFTVVIYYFTSYSTWSRTLLSVFGITTAAMWGCINVILKSDDYGDREIVEMISKLHLLVPWMQVVATTILNMALSSIVAMIWFVVFFRDVILHSVDSISCFLSTLLGVICLCAASTYCLRALKADCDLLLECAHLIRTLAAAPTERIIKIKCVECGNSYYTPHPRKTMGYCKNCYGGLRYWSHAWMGIFGLGILAWSVAFRQIAIHLVNGWWLRGLVWLALLPMSGLLWWYPLHRWWQIYHSYKRYDDEALDRTLYL